VPPGGIDNLRDLLALFVGDTVRTQPLEKDFTVGVTAVQIALPNIQRLNLYIANVGAALIVIGLSQAVTSTTGLVVPSNTGIAFSWFPDLDQVAAGMWAISANPGNAVHVVERLLIGELPT